ncbi:Protein_phosphatase 2C [Hexamita inflata]|uniref:Protein_phosphatase 2C n=1 Tax=Hexamita inflata TaxID=28002 RepID=A0ABP1GUX0_9EUKA
MGCGIPETPHETDMIQQKPAIQTEIAQQDQVSKVELVKPQHQEDDDEKPSYQVMQAQQAKQQQKIIQQASSVENKSLIAEKSLVRKVSKTVSPFSKLQQAFEEIAKQLNLVPSQQDTEILQNTVVSTNKMLNELSLYPLYPITHVKPASALHLKLDFSSQLALASTFKCFQADKIHSLDLTGQQLNLDLIKILKDFLILAKPNILILSRCGLNEQRLNALAEAFNNLQLTNLDLSQNPLTDVGVVQLVGQLEEQKLLMCVNLKQTQSRNGALRQLCDSIEPFKSLVNIDFTDNPGIGRESYQLILDTVQNCFWIQGFKIDNCGLNSQQIANIYQITQKNKDCALLFNDLTQEAIDSIVKPKKLIVKQKEELPEIQIKLNEIIQKLDNNLIMKDLAVELSTKLTNTKKINFTQVNLSISSSETMGRRQEMEDVQCIIQDFLGFRMRRAGLPKTQKQKETLLCLFDGHGGRDCSEALQTCFPAFVADCINSVMKATGFSSSVQIPEDAWEVIFTNCFVKVDQQLQAINVQAGSTGVVILIVENLVIQANCGDSRAVLSRDHNVMKQNGLHPSQYTIKKKNRVGPDDSISEVSSPLMTGAASSKHNLSCRSFKQISVQGDLSVRLSKDHKPFQDEEKKRIEKDGGFVTNGRLLGIVSVSRSFGDFNYKPAMSVIPFVSCYWLQKNDLWIAMACDGVWDVLDDQDAAMIMLGCQSAQAASIKLRDEAYRLESGDNISVICCKIVRE